MNRFLTTVFRYGFGSALGLLSVVAVAGECAHQYDSRDCWARQKALQRKLDGLYALEKEAVLRRLKDYETDAIKDVVESLQKKNAAFARFKDAECYSEPLVDGMSLRDSGVMSDSCKVEWREKRIEEMGARLKRLSR